MTSETPADAHTLTQMIHRIFTAILPEFTESSDWIPEDRY